MLQPGSWLQNLNKCKNVKEICTCHAKKTFHKDAITQPGEFMAVFERMPNNVETQMCAMLSQYNFIVYYYVCARFQDCFCHFCKFSKPQISIYFYTQKKSVVCTDDLINILHSADSFKKGCCNDVRRHWKHCSVLQSRHHVGWTNPVESQKSAIDTVVAIEAPK